MAELLTVENLSVRLGGRRALHDLSLVIHDRGSVVGLFGQNGAGKSTFMRAICGIINRYSGSIRYDGRTIAHLPDAPILYGHLRLAECIDLAQELWSDFDPAVARTVFQDLGLDLDLRLRQASKGMSEQIHLGLVLSRRTQLYVLDEPLAAVDPYTRDRLLHLIATHRQDGSTVIISTHLIAGLESLFDEALVIHDGRLVLHEAVDDIAARGGLETRIKEVIAADALAR